MHAQYFREVFSKLFDMPQRFLFDLKLTFHLDFLLFMFNSESLPSCPAYGARKSVSGITVQPATILVHIP
jgi:hypothetical protein